MIGTGMTETTIGSDSQDIVKVLRTLTVEHSLPLWSREGWDPSRGGFVEQLDIEGGADYQAPRRVRVQARQIYCFAKAAQIGWYPEGREIAIKGLDYLLAKAKSPDGRFIEGIPATLPRRQNPQMHLFEAMIATFDATGDPVYQSRAGELFGLFIANLYDAQRQVLGEYFEDDWSKIEPVCVEPGHQAEWVWLLKGFERITNCPTGRHRAELLASALRFRDDVTGCLFDEGNVDGSIRKVTRRCWPQTEIAKAWIAQAEAGEQGAADEARNALVRLYRHYLRHPVLGGWYDQFDRDNRSLVESIPASSFYHVLCAVTEAERVLS